MRLLRAELAEVKHLLLEGSSAPAVWGSLHEASKITGVGVKRLRQLCRAAWAAAGDGARIFGTIPIRLQRDGVRQAWGVWLPGCGPGGVAKGRS